MQEELLCKEHGDELNFAYLGTMMAEDHVGYNLSNVNKVCTMNLAILKSVKSILLVFSIV
jgi:hypothetical protein